jgi:hypothetical protein
VCFERWRECDRHRGPRHPQDRRLERVEGVLRHQRGDFRADAAQRIAFVGGDEPAGLAHGGADRLGIKRHDGARVDHLGLDAVLGQRVGGFECLAHHQRGRDDGDIPTFTRNTRLAERNAVVAVRNLARHGQKPGVRDDDGRVVALDR